jgi:hypothetical protein
MSKVVKLTQSDIEKIVTNIVSEQETEGYELPEDMITYDAPDERDFSAELEEVDFGDSDENEPTDEPMDEPTDEPMDGPTDEPTDEPAGVALGIGQDGYLYAIDPKTMSVVSKIKM